MLLSALFAACCLGQVAVDYKPIYEPGEPVVFKVKGAAATASVNWKFKGLRTLPGAATTEVHGWGNPGKYTGRVTVVDWDKKSFVDEDLEFEIKGAAPPVPPTPDPNPPGPTPPGPTPGPAPIAGAGLKVLIVYEQSDFAKLPPAQMAVFGAQELRSYLAAKCPAGPDGRTAEARFYDQNVDLANESKTWQDAMKRPRASLPWIVVSNGTKGTGFEGPLPATVADTLALLRKYEGQ